MFSNSLFVFLLAQTRVKDTVFLVIRSSLGSTRSRQLTGVYPRILCNIMAANMTNIQSMQFPMKYFALKIIHMAQLSAIAFRLDLGYKESDKVWMITKLVQHRIT